MSKNKITAKEAGNLKGNRPSKPEKPEKPVFVDLMDPGDLFIPEEEKDPNFTYRWVNNDKRKLQRRLKIGWEFCRTSDGDKIQVLADNEGLVTFLMKFPKDIQDERNRFKEDLRKGRKEARNEEAKTIR